MDILRIEAKISLHKKRVSVNSQKYAEFINTAKSFLG
jgi:hypothetical protein